MGDALKRHAGSGNGPPGRFRRQVRAALAVGRQTPGPDAGAGADPFVGSVDNGGQGLVIQYAFRGVVA